MKRSYIGVVVLLFILMLNIVFTQKMVHQYFFQDYVTALVLVGLNILLFPIAIYVYKRDQKREGRELR